MVYSTAKNSFLRKAAVSVVVGGLMLSMVSFTYSVFAANTAVGVNKASTSTHIQVENIGLQAKPKTKINSTSKVYMDGSVAAATSGGLKVGVISDVHLAVNQNSVGWTNSSNDTQRETNLKNVLTYYKNNNIRLLIVDGDIADQAQPGGYQLFNQIFNEVYPDAATAPQKLLVMGNHDYYGMFSSATVASEQQNFETNLNVNSINSNMEIDGYHFIGVSTEDSSYAGNFSQTTIHWLDQQLAAAAAEDPTKPIFVAFHQPVYNTLVDSEPCTNALDAVLSKYPQVIEFSGHTHDPLADERSIYQKDFTSVGTGELYYMELPSTFTDYSTANSLLVTINSDKVDIQRYDVIHNEQILNDWSISLPNTDKTKFTYTSERADASVAPAFDAGTAIMPSSVSSNMCDITFNSAKCPGSYVYSYKVETKDASTGAVVNSSIIPSDFYQGISRMAAKQTLSIIGLEQDKKYTVNVYAENCYGKDSAPITATIQTQSASTDAQSVLTVDFSDNTYKDSSSFNAAATPVGNPKIVYDDTLKKNVVQLDGNSFINYDFSDAQRSSITNQFTVEAVFKMDTIKQQAIIENLESGGIGFECNSSGKTEIWARINGSYQHDGPVLQTGQYYYETATYDGNSINVYIDGALVNTISVTGSVSYNSAVKMCIGGNPNTSGGATYPFTGEVAYVNVLSKAISVDQILKDYQTMFGLEPSTSSAASGANSSSLPVSSSSVNSVASSEIGSNSVLQTSSSQNTSSKITNVDTGDSAKLAVLSFVFLLSAMAAGGILIATHKPNITR